MSEVLALDVGQENWNARAEELYDYLHKIPKSVGEKLGIWKTRNQIVLDYDQIDRSDIDSLHSWIGKAEGLVQYIYSQRNNNPKKSKKTRINSLEDLPGYDENWHWPWIEGWDDPKKRQRLLRGKKEGTDYKKILIAGGVVAGGFWAYKKFFSGE